MSKLGHTGFDSSELNSSVSQEAQSNSTCRNNLEENSLSCRDLDRKAHWKPSSCSSCSRLKSEGFTGEQEQFWSSVITEEKDPEDLQELGRVTVLKCKFCLNFLGLLQNGLFFREEDICIGNPSNPHDNGWEKVDSIASRRLLFFLSSIVHNEIEVPEESLLETEFAFPSASDCTKILWIDNEAAGFYTVKVKGTLDPFSMGCYQMTTVDAVFVREKYRRQGFGSSAVKDVLIDFPLEDIGFSFPVSIPMQKILKDHLRHHPSDRRKFWEVTGCGTEGNVRNLWYVFQRERTVTSK